MHAPYQVSALRIAVLAREMDVKECTENAAGEAAVKPPDRP